MYIIKKVYDKDKTKLSFEKELKDENENSQNEKFYLALNTLKKSSNNNNNNNMQKNGFFMNCFSHF